MNTTTSDDRRDPIFSVDTLVSGEPISLEDSRFVSSRRYVSDYASGTSYDEASNMHLEQVYFDRHADFPTLNRLKLLRIKSLLKLRRTQYCLEKFDSIIYGDDPLAALACAYSLASNRGHRVLIVPNGDRLPDGDTADTQRARLALYDEDGIGRQLCDYLGLPEMSDFSDLDSAICVMTKACQHLNDIHESDTPRIMIANHYSLLTQGNSGYELMDENDESLCHQLFYANPIKQTESLVPESWHYVRHELAAHSLLCDVDAVHMILARQVFSTTPLPYSLDGQILCRLFQIAASLQSVYQITEHTDFDHYHRLLDLLGGGGAHLLDSGKATVQDFIQSYYSTP